MNYARVLGTMTVMLALGAIAAASAVAALPMLKASTFPLTLEGATAATAPTLLETGVLALEGKGAKLSLTAASAGNTGVFKARFTNVKEGSTACNSVGAPPETVVSPGKYTFVFVALTPLTIGIVFAPENLTVECGVEKVKIKGQVVASVTATLNGLVKSVKATLSGALSKQALTEYLDNTGTPVKNVFLFMNFGLGFERADENISEEITLKTTSVEFEIEG
jgi:hypothetical protein